MLLLEDHARLLLVVHTALAVALVAASTHLVVWMRPYLGKKYVRHRAIRRFAYISLTLFAATFVVGNLVYPVYKVRVRVQYLEHGEAVIDRARAEAEASARIRHRWDEAQAVRAGRDPRSIEAPAAARIDAASETEATFKTARWFDVKEHWVALGLALAAACAVILTVWDPRRGGEAIAPVVFGLAAGAALSAWLGAIIGVVTASFRAVG